MAPCQIDELLLRWKVEVKQSFDEFGPLDQTFKSLSGNQIAFTKLENGLPMPLLPFFDSEDSCVFDLLLELGLIYVSIVLILQVLLMI